MGILRRRGLRRWLPVFVARGETFAVLMLAANAFLLMMAYYILKTIREPLILQGGGYGISGEELKTYATAGQAVLLLGLVPLYCRIARSIDRRQLIRRTVGFSRRVLAGVDAAQPSAGADRSGLLPLARVRQPHRHRPVLVIRHRFLPAHPGRAAVSPDRGRCFAGRAAGRRHRPLAARTPGAVPVDVAGRRPAGGVRGRVSDHRHSPARGGPTPGT